MADIRWIDFRSIGIEGQAWQDMPHESVYDRFPAEFKGRLAEGVWGNSHSTTGMCISFITDSPVIYIRREFAEAQLEEHNFNNCSFSGFDLYAEDRPGKFRWVATTSHRHGNDSEYPLTLDPIRGRHRYRLYLPCRNQLLKAELGIAPDAMFEAVAPRPETEALVYYGSSIVHGAYSSHAGLCHPAWLARKLNIPSYNFGFSGAARMELELAEIFATLNPAVYIIDAMPNMCLNQIRTNAKPFLKRLRELRPHTPILLMEDAPKTNGWFFREKLEDNRRRWNAMRKVYRELCEEGEHRMAYLKGNTLFGTDNEAAIDGVHPSDLGYVRMVEQILPVLKKLLKSRG